MSCVSFLQLVISFSLWCLSSVLQLPWFCSKPRGSLFFSTVPKHPRSPSMLSVRQDRNQSHRQPPEKPECWTYISLLSFHPLPPPPIEKPWIGFTPNCAELCWLGGGSTWVRGNGLSNPFQCSWLWACLRCCNFFTGFSRSHKGFWTVVKSAPLWENKVLGFLVCRLTL